MKRSHSVPLSKAHHSFTHGFNISCDVIALIRVIVAWEPLWHLPVFGVRAGYHDSDEDLSCFRDRDLRVPDGDGNLVIDECFLHFELRL